MSRDATVLAALENATELSVAFARHWLSLPTHNLIPSRDDFMPESIPGLLPNLIIHELISPEHIRLRLVGTAVVDDFGHELTNRNYLDFVEESRRPKASRSIFLICDQPAGMLVQMKSTAASGKTMIRESIAFPMRDHDGEARLVFYCSNPARERPAQFEERDALKVMRVLDRRYLDIGNGVPIFSD